MGLFSERELRSRTKNQLAYRVYLDMRGIKVRCRKVDNHGGTLGFLDRHEHIPLTKDDIDEIKEKAKAMVEQKMKHVVSAKIQISPVEYEAPKDGTIFSAIKEQLFDPNTIKLDVA